MYKKLISSEIEEYISLLIKRKVLSPESLNDKMLLNHFCFLRIDKDFLYPEKIS